MFRILFAFTAIIAATPLPAQTAPDVAPAVPKRAIIYSATDSASVDHFDENTAVTRGMTERLVMAVTGQPDITRAWRTLVSPSDRVGIKVSTIGGKYLSSHSGVVGAVISGLERAGVPRSRIILWDRNASDLNAAGFLQERNGITIKAINPPQGFDSAAKINAPVLGKLIWGDVLFRGQRSNFRRVENDTDEGISSESHLPSILTRDVTKIINVAVLVDEPGCGIAGTLYNMTVSNLDNNRRFSHPQGSFSIPEVYADPRIGPKVVLHILDGIIAQYAAGPAFNANYAFGHGTIYASKDPVALDANAIRLMEKWRTEAKLPPIGRRTAWLQEAEQLGVGLASEDKIEIKPLSQLP